MSEREPQPPLRVSLVQFRPEKADPEANIRRVAERVAEEAPLTDLVVFPETALSGYFLEGGVAEAARSAEWVMEVLGDPPPDAPDLVLGFYERWRSRFYNSVAYLTRRGSRWALRYVHRKMFLPTYGVFDEDRFVEAGTEIRAFDTRFGRMGMLICEEMWHSLPATILAVDGAELLLVVSASPARDFQPNDGRPANLERWIELGRGAAIEHGVFVAVAQLVGSEGGKLFPGGAQVFAPDGDMLAEGPLFEEAVVRVALDAGALERARVASPLLADLERMLPHLQRALEAAGRAPAVREDTEAAGEARDDEDVVEAPSVLRGRGEPRPVDPGLTDPRALELDLELVERTLVAFIQDEVRRRRGFERVVVGVSGGVDSAVSLVLACRALGPEHVFGFRLPYRTSSPESLEHAALILERTGAHARTIEITGPIHRYVEEYEPDITPLRKGNLMARLRAVILFDQSAKLRALPLGTGNKSERLLGYFTWHADDSPPINPLGDLFKTQVWALARHLGVPEEIVEKPATADLVKGVTDEDEIGVSYHDADPILNGLVKGYTPEELVRIGFPEDHVRVVWNRLRSTHWKRELPTVAVLSSSAIGEFYLRPVDF